jgi:predicted dehydrogenase
MEEIDEFADSIRTGATPETDGESALEALKLIRAAIDSARTGEKTAIQSYS